MSRARRLVEAGRSGTVHEWWDPGAKGA